jgi:MFS transporter, OFA family, oxalate/formate antiporter
VVRKRPVTLNAEVGTTGLFYGWVVTWAAFGILAIAYGVQFSFGVFLPEIVEETGWSRTQLSLVISGYILAYSLLSGFSGALTDRSGPRPVIVFGSLFLGAGYVAAAAAQELWQFAVALAVVAAIGMSATFVPCSATVARWFNRDRGKALGIATSGGSFGGFFIPPIAGLLTSSFDWRWAYAVLGIVAMVLMLAASFLIVRSPAERGLEVDGLASPPVDSEPIEVWGLTRAEAMRTPVFWVAGGIFFFTWMAVFMPLVHLVPFAEDLGIGKATASTMISAIGIGGLLGRTSTGLVSDRIGRLPSLAVVLTVQVASFMVFATGETLLVLYPGAVAFGFAYGGTTTMFPAIFSDQFGPAHIGAIVGAVFSVAGSSAAFGPTVAGYLYDVTDSYRLAFTIGGGMNLVALALVGVLRVFLARQRDAIVVTPAR